MENAQLSLPLVDDELVRIGYLPPVRTPKKVINMRPHRHIVAWVRDETIPGTHNMKPVFCDEGCEYCASLVPPVTNAGEPDQVSS